MGTDQNGDAKLANSEWLKFIGVILGHAIIVFSAILFWANRVVKVETKVENLESTVTEVRSDVKEILRQTR